MRILISCFFFLSVNACSPKTTSPSTTASTAISHHFDWLIGDWKRTNDEPGNQTFESWKKLNDQLYVGKGWTMKNLDTLSQEHMHIKQLDQKWILEVSLPGVFEVLFDCKQSTSSSFEFENEANDFPKLIKYNFDGKDINAEISGGGPTIPFTFQKIEITK